MTRAPAPSKPSPSEDAATAPAAAPIPETTAALERLEMRMLRARVVRDVSQVFAVTAAAAWALYIFWYQASYVPAHEVPNVVVTSSLEIAADRDGFVALKAKVSAHNPGKARVRMISESLSLVGARFAEGRGVPLTPAALPAGQTNWLLGNGVDPTSAALLASEVRTHMPPGDTSLEPGETIERTQVFRVSKYDWDTVTLIYYACFNNHNQPMPERYTVEPRPYEHGVVLSPVLPKDAGRLSFSDTDSQAIVVLPR